MTEQEFLQVMIETAVKTRTELDDMTNEIYWGMFQNWPIHKFRSAMDSCSRELTRFPTVADVNNHRPVDHRTYELEKIRSWEQERAEYESVFAIPDTSDPDERINNLTDDDLRRVFAWLGNVGDEIEWQINMYRKMPDSKLYRDVIREWLARPLTERIEEQ